MKILKSIRLIILGGCLFTSCSDILLEKPTTFIDPEAYFNTVDEARIALNGVYSSLQNTNRYAAIPGSWGFNGVDEAIAPVASRVRDLYMYNIDPQNSQIISMWMVHYEAIQRANAVINRVSKMELNDIQQGEQNQILGEARFLRAFWYFQLVKIWGKVPLKTEETVDFEDRFIAQATEEVIYEQIIQDLIFSESSLENEQGGGRATNGAAKALLGKVYLQMTGFPLYDSSKFALAAEKLKEVIDNPVYGLLNDYSLVFDYQNENNKEIILSVQFLSDMDEYGDVGHWIGPRRAVEWGGGGSHYSVNTNFALSYDQSGDSRFAQNISTLRGTGAGLLDVPRWWRPWKFKKPIPCDWGSNSPIDYPLIRYADVLLLYSEALNGINSTPPKEAYDAINLVRKRARKTPNALPDLSGLTKEEFRTALLKERAWELCYEGHRKDDLIRFDKLIDVVKAISGQAENANPGEFIREHHRYWPIPQRELDINKNLVQNEGYN